MQTLIRLAAVTLMILVAVGPAAAGDAFVLGVAPHTSARVILEMYQPLRLSLEKALSTTVEVVTAPDFTEFARRGLAQEYDLAVTTGHQARLLQTDAKYLPVLTYKADFKAVSVVVAGSAVRKPSDLAGKDVLGLSPSSLVTLWGQHWLKENRVETRPMRYVSASDSVAQLLVAGDAAAGFMSLANWQKLPPELQRQLRILAESKGMAGRVYVLNARLAARRQQIDAALWSFASTPEAKKYFDANQLEGYRKLKPGELESMDAYAAETRKTLGGAK